MDWTIVWLAGAAFILMILVRRALSASPAELRKHLQEGALVIDVRSPEEFRSGNVPGAVNIPLDQLRDQVLARVPDKSRVLLLHCQSGGRSALAKHQLKGMGYANVFNLGSLTHARRIVSTASDG